MTGAARTFPRDLLELIALPALAVFLPWRVCYGIYRQLARWDWLFSREVDAAEAGACRISRIADRKTWRNDHRLIRMVDCADLFLSRFRSDAWLARHVRLTGKTWPQDGYPFLAVTFHWGAGMWGLRHLRHHAGPAAALSLNLDEGQLRALPLWGIYARMRTRESERAMGGQMIYTGGNSLRAIRRALNGGQRVVALFDVPAEGGRNRLEVDFLGRTGVFPRGLAYLAARDRLPVVVFTVGLDRGTGERLLHIDDVLRSEDEAWLSQALASRLELAISRDPMAWHQWAGVSAFCGGASRPAP